MTAHDVIESEASVISDLRQIALFHALPGATLVRLAADSSRLNLPRGERLFDGSRRAPGVHAVVSGCLMLGTGTSACMKVIELVSAGGHLGLAAAVLGVRDGVWAEALANTEVVLIPRTTLLACAEDTPRFALRLATALSRQVEQCLSDIESMSLRSGHQRVADYLRQLAAGAAGQFSAVTLPAKKSIIASRLSLTPEYFSRVLHDLTASGAISVNGRQITVLDPLRLDRHEA
jgi:CRP/FNR family transcriptional regulator, dissimilatory nitrate respiration regulator